jgi:translation elongation factor EF-Ts
MLRKAGKAKAEKMYGRAAKTGTKAAAAGGSYARNYFKNNSK